MLREELTYFTVGIIIRVEENTARNAFAVGFALCGTPSQKYYLLKCPGYLPAFVSTRVKVR